MSRILSHVRAASASGMPCWWRTWRWTYWKVGGMPQGTRFKIKAIFPGIDIPAVKMSWSWDCLMFKVGIPILVRQHPYSERPSGPFLLTFPCRYRMFCANEVIVMHVDALAPGVTRTSRAMVFIICRIKQSLSSISKDFNFLCHLTVEKW